MPPPQRADAETVRVPPPSEPAPTTPIDDSRFTAGTLLAGRYRIVGRIGRGGMGEVYRADDLKLGQSVALKFLPESLARDAVWLRRLHDEVRIAREVAHPNVCRVYDIGEIDGDHFITMEYVDGEDLALLLRRIGRLPKNKAIQIARQLCGGLGAAHDKGVLHRDLKPANIMLDGRGHVRITDFGIAAMAGRVDGKHVRSGTPAYMAPEQLAGREVSTRSDIYSLGLVLYEVFTGREAYNARSLAELNRLRESGPPSSPSSFVEDMDPTVERVILRCLENEPADRPASAIAVAAALPGGDPLAAALAAGETPSPEMVAEGGASGGLRPAIAVSCLGGLVIGTAVAIVAASQTNLLNQIPFDRPFQVLADRADEITRHLGYTDPPADRASWLSVNRGYLTYIEENDKSAERWDRLSSGRPSAVQFEHRTSPRPMAPITVSGQVDWRDPPFRIPGMIRLSLDTQGQLIRFEAIAEAVVEEDAAAEHGAADWSALFGAAGLDAAAFTPVEPSWTPSVYCDTRAAWDGSYPESPEYSLHIEAGSFGGRPVYFRTIGPWEEPPGSSSLFDTTGERIVAGVFLTLFFVVPVGAGLIAFRHLKAGRGDRRGAFRLAVYVFGISFGTWLFTADHMLSIFEWRMLSLAFGSAAGFALLCWILYLAVEPYARRYWPHAMVSWTRLLAGKFRDPLVGRDALFGCLSGLAIFLIIKLSALMTALTGGPPPAPTVNGNPEVFRGARYVAGALLDAQTGIGVFIGAFVLLLLLRIVLRRMWPAIIAFFVILLVLFTEGFTESLDQWIGSGLIAAVLLVTMIRFGLLSLVVMAFVVPLFFMFPLTVDFSHWYAALGMVAPAVVVALGAYGFWTALAGQPLFRDELAEA